VRRKALRKSISEALVTIKRGWKGIQNVKLQDIGEGIQEASLKKHRPRLKMKGEPQPQKSWPQVRMKGKTYQTLASKARSRHPGNQPQKAPATIKNEGSSIPEGSLRSPELKMKAKHFRSKLRNEGKGIQEVNLQTCIRPPFVHTCSKLFSVHVFVFLSSFLRSLLRSFLRSCFSVFLRFLSDSSPFFSVRFSVRLRSYFSVFLRFFSVSSPFLLRFSPFVSPFVSVRISQFFSVSSPFLLRFSPFVSPFSVSSPFLLRFFSVLLRFFCQFRA
jgi:hypothetical protein